MKKSRIFLLMAGIALLFASCSDLGSDDSTITNGYKSVEAANKTLTINATSADGALTFPVADSGAGRTIMADSIDASNVYFYLASWDTLANDAETWNFNTSPLNFTATAGSTTRGSIDATFEVSVYRFILYACPSNTVTNRDAANDSAYFIGYASADLRYADEITFYLTAENVSGSADVNLSLFSSNTASTTDLWKIPAGYIVRASIRNMNDDSIVPSGVQPQYMLGSTSSAGIGAEATLAGVATPAGQLAVFTQETVPAGEYSFEVAFIDTNNNNKTYSYTEQIIVLPNQPITKNVFVTDVLEKVPEKPSSFFVAYADPVSKTDDYYYAQFAWSDNSDNERSFVIQLMDISDGIDNTQSANALTTYKNFAVPVSDDSWEGLWKKVTGSSGSYDDTTNITTYRWNDYQTSEFNADPSKYSLIKNNETAMFLLPLGKRYVARIKATNDIGDSDWSYVVIGDQNTAHGDTTSGTAAETTGCISTAANKHTCTQTILLMDGVTYKATTAEIPETPANNKFASLKMTLFPKDSTTAPLSYTVAINRFRVTYQIGDGEFYNKYDTTTYASNKGYGDDSMTQPVVVSYHTQTIGAAPETASANGTSTTTSTMNKIAILAPLGLKQNYYKASAALEADKAEDYVYLVENEQLFTRWLLTSTTDSGKFSYETGNRYPYSSTTASAATDFETNFSDYSVSPRVYNMPNGYTGHENIELFASYAVDTTLQVEIAAYTSYEWVGFGDVTDSTTNPVTTSTKSDISLNGTDSSSDPVYFEDYLDTDGANKTYCQKGDYVKVSVTSSPTVTFTVNTTAKGYDSLTLQIRRTSSSTYKYKSIKELDLSAYNESTGWTAAPASWTVNVKSWKSGVYECQIIGTTSKYPNKEYCFPVTLYIVD